MTKLKSFIQLSAAGVLSAFLLSPLSANAQASSGTSANDIEGIFSDDAPASAESSPSVVQPSTNEESLQTNPDPAVNRTNPAQDSTGNDRADKAVEKKMRGVSDLAGLEPLKDIAVIQKRFLPKTGRFELFLAASDVLNDVFFTNFGLEARFAYYFQERYGIEFTGAFLKSVERDSVKGLLERGIQTQSFVTPKSYYGLDFKWSPIYGKMTFLNKRIVPFDMYFSAGVGSTGTSEAGTDPTLHLGSGQIFAITKGSAFRWDISLNSFYAKSIVQGGTSTLYNNLLISLGVSFFFPEATYR